MTKEMYDKCRNPGMVAFVALPDDVKAELEKNKLQTEWFDSSGEWRTKDQYSYSAHLVYRIKECCKPEEYEYRDIAIIQHHRIESVQVYVVPFSGYNVRLPYCLSYVGFDGIEYRLPDGGTTWAMRVDQSIGVPVRVRFKK